MKKIIVALAAAFTLAAMAQGPAEGAPARPRGGHMGPPMMMMDPVLRAVMMPKVAEKLNLTEEQRTKIDALKGEKESNAALQEKVRLGMQKQADLLKADKIDEAAVMAALDEVWEARKAIAKAQTRRVIAVKSILTPEQIKQAMEEVKNLRGNVERRRGPRPEGARGPRGARGKGAKAAEAPAASAN